MVDWNIMSSVMIYVHGKTLELGLELCEGEKSDCTYDVSILVGDLDVILAIILAFHGRHGLV